MESLFHRVLQDAGLFAHICSFMPGTRGAEWEGEPMARRAARGALVGVFCLFGDRLPVTPEVLAEAASSGAWEFFEGLMAAHPDVVLLPRTLEAAAAAVSDPFGSCRAATN